MIREATEAQRRTLRVPFPASVGVSVGDLCYWDNSAKFAKPATSRADTGSKSGNQLDFAPLFMGVAADQRLATETSVTTVASSPTGPSDRLLVPEGIFDCDCASATFEFGDLVGVVRDATPLNTSQQVVGVTGSLQAVGFVVKREPTAVTKVRCFLSAYLFGWFGRTKDATGDAILSGTGAPTMSAPKGTLYVRLDGSSTSTRLYVNSDGGTTWVSVTTSA